MPKGTGEIDNTTINNRLAERHECWCSLQFHHNYNWERGIATDISETGIHVVTLHPLKTGETIKLSFDEPGTLGRRTLIGTVKWQSELSPFESHNWLAPSMGIQFQSKFPISVEKFAQTTRK